MLAVTLLATQRLWRGGGGGGGVGMGRGGGGAIVACSTKSEGTLLQRGSPLSQRGPHFCMTLDGLGIISQARHYFQLGVSRVWCLWAIYSGIYRNVGRSNEIIAVTWLCQKNFIFVSIPLQSRKQQCSVQKLCLRTRLLAYHNKHWLLRRSIGLFSVYSTPC